MRKFAVPLALVLVLLGLKLDIKTRLEQLKDSQTNEASVVAELHDASAIYGRSRHAATADMVVGYPALVPGVLFTSFKTERDVGSIADVPLLIKSKLGLTGHVDPALTAPSRGWLDAGSPLFSWIDDHLLAWLPGVLRIVLWALLASVGSMAIYKWTSNQVRIVELKAEILDARNKLNEFDGELADLWPLLWKNISSASRQLGLTFFPAMIASLPVLLILVWMSNTYDSLPPPAGQRIRVEAVAAATHQLPPMHWDGGDAEEVDGNGAWLIAWPSVEQPMRLVDSDGITLVQLPGEALAGTIHQKRWWNALVGNPGGYLPSPGDVDTVSIDLPRKEFHSFGPDWLRSWITLFFSVVVIMSLGLKRAWRLH